MCCLSTRFTLARSSATHLSVRDVASRVNNVAYPASLDVALLLELVCASSELGNLLVVLSLLDEKLRGVALGLLDGANLLLEGVDGAALALHLVERWWWRSGASKTKKLGATSREPQQYDTRPDQHVKPIHACRHIHKGERDRLNNNTSRVDNKR